MRLVLQREKPVFCVGRFADRVALHLEVDAHHLADLGIVVDEQNKRAARRLARPRPLEERLEVAALVAPVAAGRIESRNPPEIRPFADRALRDAEKLRRLAQGQPVAVAASGPPCVGRHTRESTQT